MEADPLLIQAEQKLINQADELVVLIDATKFERRSSLILCGLDRIATVITDERVDDRAAAMLRGRGRAADRRRDPAAAAGGIRVRRLSRPTAATINKQPLNGRTHMSIWKTLLASAAVAPRRSSRPGRRRRTQKRIALVVKALGIGFFEAAAKGAEEAAAELGDVEIIYTGPTDTTAEGQIEVINSLIAQKVDAIAISANDQDALVPALKKAMDRGITVISWDIGRRARGPARCTSTRRRTS